ncbi:MAG: DUF1206 domain-containing protein [Acidimicrobiales bacterium]
MTSVLHRQRAAHDHPTVTTHRGVSILGHVGLAARGVLYVLLGYLALRIAFGVSTSTANRKGALQTIAHQPYGAFLLGAMAVGFGAYALWQLTVAGVGGSSRGQSGGAGRRLIALVTGVLYGFFCFTTAALAAGSSRSSGSTSTAVGWTGKIMAHSHGRIVVGVVGAVVVIVGLVMAGRALSGRRDVPLKSMTRSTRRVVEGLAKVGLTARAFIIAAAGVFIVRAAQTFNPAKVKGFDGVLQSFAHTAVGPWLLVAVAIGVVAFGLYSLAAAKYAEL